MKQEVEQYVKQQLQLLKNGLDNETYEYIISEVLKIYDQNLKYSQVIKEIEKEIDGLSHPGNAVYWSAIYCLSQAISCQGVFLSHAYEGEQINDEKAFVHELGGEIHDLIKQESCG